jgi:hypothetical protein
VSISAQQACQYLVDYVRAYRDDYGNAVAAPPEGGGYPRIDTSSYLSASELICWLTPDGYALADLTTEPPYRWEIAGGPALVSDIAETRVPAELTAFLASKGLKGKPIGLYRIVAKEGIPDDVWRGVLPHPTEERRVAIDHTTLTVRKLEIPWLELIRRLTFGAYALILDLHLPDSAGPFWRPHVVRRLGFVPADRNAKRFFNYLELSPHVDSAAWDARAIPVRVRADVRRDFARTLASAGRPGGVLEFGPEPKWPTHFVGLLASLVAGTSSLRTLLEASPDAQEGHVHEVLKAHPLLIDVYGEVVSKPRFIYPRGESPLGKDYVEPDFLVRYPDNTYRLIEIERPGKRIATIRGEPRAEVGQAAFQIAEWRTYIQKHYDQLRDAYPGISTACRTTLVIGRDVPESFGPGRNIRDYKEILRNQYNVDDVLTYDDLVVRAEAALARLADLPHAS